MNKSTVELRLAELTKALNDNMSQVNQLVANQNAIQGAIQEAKHWLTVLPNVAVSSDNAAEVVHVKKRGRKKKEA